MRQRANAIGGEWQILSEPGRGTRISVRVTKQAS
jgi:signal transduction histidine kinase